MLILAFLRALRFHILKISRLRSNVGTFLRSIRFHILKILRSKSNIDTCISEGYKILYTKNIIHHHSM